MLENPILKYCYHAQFIDGEKVLLASERDNTLLSGKQYTQVLAEIHEEAVPLEKLLQRLEGRLSHLEVYYALEMMERQGYITEAAPHIPQAQNAYWNCRKMDPLILEQRLQQQLVRLIVLEPLSAEVFTQTFASVGIRLSENEGLSVVVTDEYEREELRVFNNEAVANGTAWLPLKPTGVELWLGPLFVPGKTGCWECLKQRLEINRPINTFYRTQQKTDAFLPLPQSYLPLTLQAAAGRAALEVLKWIYYGTNETLEGKLHTLNTESWESREHQLVKRAQCPVCGDPLPAAATAVVLTPDAARCSAATGGYRQVEAEDTLEKYKHHVSPITGVVQSLKPYYSIKDAPIYNYSSGHNMALQSRTMYWLNEHIRSASGGKGKSWSQAKVGALCEAIERYCIIYDPDRQTIRGSLRQLGENALHPNDCMRFSQKQYREREETNRANAKFYTIVPVPFDEDMEMEWTPVYSLTEKRFKYLPTCFCYSQYPAEDERNLFSYPDSNGCAAGNSMEEAILQGLMELVERDCVALWWYNRLSMPGVDLDSFQDPYFSQLQEFYKTLNRSLYVLDLTSDLKVPAFAALSYRIDDPQRQDILFGFGAHVDARIAIERALVELNQLLPIANVSEEARRKGRYRTPDKAFLNWLNQATIENQPYLSPRSDIPLRTVENYPQLCKAGIYDAVVYCLKQAEQLGMELLVLDLTRRDIGLNVARVFMPGMYHFWKRTAPGRLYDVPVNAGLLKEPRREEDLNPVALFI